MKKIFPLLTFCLLATVALAQEKIVYDAHAEQRTINGSFHAIKVSHGIELLLKQGDTEALAISAEEKEYRDAVKTEIVNGELQIYVKQDLEKWWRQLRSKGKKVKAYVSFKNLQSIDGSSGAKITVDGNLKSNDLGVDLSSGASLKGTFQVLKMEVEQSSGAVSNVSGSVQSLNVETSSGAHFYGYDLVAETCNADASSGGKIELQVEKEMVAHASSGGAIQYKGKGSIREVSTSSGGKVRRGS